MIQEGFQCAPAQRSCLVSGCACRCVAQEAPRAPSAALQPVSPAKAAASTSAAKDSLERACMIMATTGGDICHGASASSRSNLLQGEAWAWRNILTSMVLDGAPAAMTLWPARPSRRRCLPRCCPPAAGRTCCKAHRPPAPQLLASTPGCGRPCPRSPAARHPAAATRQS